MMKSIKLLNKLIQDERAKVKSFLLRKDDFTKKLLLLELTRAIDLFYLATDKNNDELNALYQYGWNEVLSLIFGKFVNSGKYPLIRSTRESWEWANSIIQHCGRVAFCKKIIAFCKANLAYLDCDEDNNVYVYFTDVRDWEQFDRDSFNWFQAFVRAYLKDPKIKELEKKFPKIQRLLQFSVDTWRTHFIQYESIPEIDEYYDKLGYLISLPMVGRENFSDNAKFGGIEYKNYCQVLEVIIGIALKHVAFCKALVEKEASTKLENITTIVKERNLLAESVARYMAFDIKDVQQILDCLTLSTENGLHHLSIRQGPPPPFIKLADNLIIQSIAGCQANPYEFLNRELKRRYEKNYFMAVNEREGIFRDQLYYMFPENYFKKIKKAITVKWDNIETDIDAVIFDSDSKTLALFQLKWQDIFGHSLKERYSRITNFYPKTVEWIEKIELWLKSNNQKTILSTLGLGNENGFDKVLIFVINRNAAFFTGFNPDERVAWATWYQFFRIFSNIPKNMSNKLGILYKIIKKNSPVYKEPQELGDYKFKLGGYNLILKAKLRYVS